jgi:hypothetical protein
VVPGFGFCNISAIAVLYGSVHMSLQEDDDRGAGPAASAPQKGGRRVPVGHEPHPDEVEALLGWLHPLAPRDRYLAASDLEGLYWASVMKLHEIRALAIFELHEEHGYSHGRIARDFGVTRSWAQLMVRKGRALAAGDLTKFRWRSETPPPDREGSEKSAALAAIHAYLKAVESESPDHTDQGPEQETAPKTPPSDTGGIAQNSEG